MRQSIKVKKIVNNRWYHCVFILDKIHADSWWRGPAVEHWSLADVLSLSCARLVADG